MADVLIRDVAEEEYRQAYDWYGARSQQAADRFESAFRETVGRIGDWPEMYAVVDEDGNRLALMGRYPYGVIYYLDGGTAVVIAVAHTSRRPGYWQGRS